MERSEWHTISYIYPIFISARKNKACCPSGLIVTW